MNDNAMVPIGSADPESAVTVLNNVLGYDRPRVWSSLREVTQADKLKLYLAEESDSEGLADVVNTVITVEHLLIKEFERVLDGGLVEPGFRIVFLCSDGRFVGTCSKGARRSLSAFVRRFGLPDTWARPQKFLVKQVNLPPDPATGTPRFTYELVPQFDAVPNAKGKDGAK